MIVKGRSSRASNLLARLRPVLVALSFIGVLSASSHGQFRSTQWTSDSGLPQNSVRGIVLTPDGYVWIATLNGVTRFDGVRFVTFDKSNTPAITTNRFVSMVGGVPGDLWLASEDGNLVRYHDGKFIAIGKANGVEPKAVSEITSDGRGGVWVLSGGRIYRWNESTNQFVRITENQDLHFNRLWWIGTGFWAVDGPRFRYLFRGVSNALDLPKEISTPGIRAASVSGEGFVWISTLDGKFYRFADGEWQMIHGMVESPLQGRGQPGWRYQVQDNFTRTAIIPSNGFEKGIRYNIIARDNGDNIWIGAEGQGLYRVQRQSITVFSTDGGLAGANVYPVLNTKNGDIWVGTWGPAGISQIRDGVVKTYTAKDGVPGLVTALAEDHEGRLWIGSHGGVRVLMDGRFTRPPGVSDEIRPNVIYENADGSMLLGTFDGIDVVQGATSHRLTVKDGLATNDVRVIVPSKDGGLWIGGYGGLTRMKDGHYTRWTEREGLPSNNIRTLYEDASGDLWIGTYDGGLGLLRKGKITIFNKRSGLYDDGVFQILEDSRENLWMSSNRGIYRVGKKQLVSFAEGGPKQIESIGYGKSDGMLSVECNGGLWPSGAKDRLGNLWFPTQNGVAVLNPDALNKSMTPPRVGIEGLSIDHNEQTPGSDVTLHPGQNTLEIQYTALGYIKPEQTNFQYKLDGIDSDWEYVGQRRTAYYKHLPPGSYVFRLKALSSEGVASVDDATLAITVIPPFYRRWWFVGGIGLLLLAVSWIIWNYRIRQLKRMQVTQKAFSQQLIASQEAERRRIAAELHDSLGQRLIVINNLALFLLRPKGRTATDDDKRQTIQEISTEATAAMEETRAISYDLRPFQLDRLGLAKAIQGLARTASLASGIAFSTEVGDIDDFFRDELRINFFRIVQEGVNNIIKHSKATKASITALKDGDHLLLTISDNGRGLPAEPQPLKAGPGGFGLTGITERASLLHGSVKIRNQAGGGTQLAIHFLAAKEPVQ